MCFSTRTATAASSLNMHRSHPQPHYRVHFMMEFQHQTIHQVRGMAPPTSSHKFGSAFTLFNSERQLVRVYQIPGICCRRWGWIIRWGIMSSPLSWRQLAFSIAAAASCCWGIFLRHSASLPRNLPNTSPVKFADVRFISRMWGASWLSAGPPDSSSHYLFLVYFFVEECQIEEMLCT